MTRQIQRDIGALADLGAGVGICQQPDSQLLVGILRQHGAGGIHSLLQAVVNHIRSHDLRDPGFHLGHAQGQGVSALDGVVVDGFIFQGLAGILVQPAAIVVDSRCHGQVQHGIGLGLVGIHILAQLGAVVLHRAATRYVDNQRTVGGIVVIGRGADAAAVAQGGVAIHRTAYHLQGLGGAGVLGIVIDVILAALFRLKRTIHIDAAASLDRVAGNFAVGQVDAAAAVLVVQRDHIQAAAVRFGRIFGDGGFGHIQRGQLTRVDTACHTATGVLGNVAVLQVDRQAVAFMAADPQTASAAALIIGDFAAGKGRFHLLLLAFANRCQRASQAYSTVLAFVVGDLAVFHRKELLVHIERTYVIVTCAAGIVGQDTVAPGSACLYAVTGIVIPIVLVQVRNVHRRIQTVGVVLNGHVIKRAVGRHIIRIVLVVAAAQHADDTALALGVGKAGVGNFKIVAVMDKQYGIISAIAADGVVVKHSVGNLGTVAEIIGIRDINSISRGHVFDDAAVVDKDLTLCLTAAGVANIVVIVVKQLGTHDIPHVIGAIVVLPLFRQRLLHVLRDIPNRCLRINRLLVCTERRLNKVCANVAPIKRLHRAAVQGGL